MTETDGKKKIIVVSFLAMLIGSIMLIITLFVPFASATDDHREYLEKYANTVSIEELDITNEQLLDVSLFKFARIYSALSGMEISRDKYFLYCDDFSICFFCAINIAFFYIKESNTCNYF